VAHLVKRRRQAVSRAPRRQALTRR
jgi:hypothetical protein